MGFDLPNSVLTCLDNVPMPLLSYLALILPLMCFLFMFFRSFLFIHASFLPSSLAVLHMGMECSWVWRSWLLKNQPGLLDPTSVHKYILWGSSKKMIEQDKHVVSWSPGLWSCTLPCSFCDPSHGYCCQTWPILPSPTSSLFWSPWSSKDFSCQPPVLGNCH